MGESDEAPENTRSVMCTMAMGEDKRDDGKRKEKRRKKTRETTAKLQIADGKLETAMESRFNVIGTKFDDHEKQIQRNWEVNIGLKPSMQAKNIFLPIYLKIKQRCWNRKKGGNYNNCSLLLVGT